MVRPMKGITQKLSGEWQAVQEERLEISTIWWISKKKKKKKRRKKLNMNRRDECRGSWVTVFFFFKVRTSLFFVSLWKHNSLIFFSFYPSFSREFLSPVVSWHEVSMQETERHGQDIKRHAFPDRGIFVFICAAVIYLLEMKGPFFFSFFLFPPASHVLILLSVYLICSKLLYRTHLSQWDPIDPFN